MDIFEIAITLVGASSEKNLSCYLNEIIIIFIIIIKILWAIINLNLSCLKIY